ncbi:MAG: transposase [Clostridiales bacterium]|nr:transposase [Clostridiales bacterium]
MRFTNFHGELHPVDVTDLWMNSGYDEEGMSVSCDRCDGEMRWSPTKRLWYCPECGQEMDRAEWFNYIGAEPPGADCESSCCENYPFCKKHCTRYTIDPNDPMLD